MSYSAFKSEHERALDARVAQIVQALGDDPYEVLERSGASNGFIDAVAERHVFRAALRRPTSVGEAIEGLDRFAVIFVQADGPLVDAYMRERVNTWIQAWRRRLEKLQRENPGV